MLHTSIETLRERRDGVVDEVRKKVKALFLEHQPWLLPLWQKAEGLTPTRDMILGSWDHLVDLLLAGHEKKPTTKTATTFTLARMREWPERLKTWMDHEEIRRLAYETIRIQGLHYLCNIVNFVDEVR